MIAAKIHSLDAS
jgi:hypothetical protein